jgi:hypothetical protein
LPTGMTQAQINAANAAKKKAGHQRTQKDKNLINMARYYGVSGFNKNKLPAGYKPPKGGGPKPGQAAAGKPGQRPGQRPNQAGKPGGAQTGLYGKGGEQGWLASWNKAFTDKGLAPVAPAQWAKMLGYKPPPHVKGPSKYGHMEGDSPFDVVPGTDAGRLYLLNLATGRNYADLGAAMADLGPEYSFAGAQQYRLNRSGSNAEVAGNPALHSVSMQDATMDEPTKIMLINRIIETMAEGGPQAAQALIKSWEDIAPDWAQGTADKLHEGGTRFTTELFGSPEVQWDDPTQPLFGQGSHPDSLMGLTGFGAGEEAFYRNFSAQQLMEEVFPQFSQYYHREAGSEAPFPGLMFGQISENPNWNVPGAENWVTSGVPYRDPHPIRDSLAYNIWSKYGMPGDYTMNGNVRGPNGSWYNPLSQEGSPGTGMTPFGAGMLDGSILPQHLAGGATDWSAHSDLALSEFGNIGASVFLDDPSIYLGDLAHENIDPNFIARMIAVMQDPYNPYA